MAAIPFDSISDTLRNWTSKIEIWPRITAFISEIFSTITGPSADVGGQGKWKSGQFCLVPVRPDRQRADFFYNSDRIRTADRIDTDRIRTDRHRTENPNSIQTPDTIFRTVRRRLGSMDQNLSKNLKFSNQPIFCEYERCILIGCLYYVALA